MWYNENANDTLKKLGAGKDGLTSKEAAERLALYGPNELGSAKRKNFLRRYLSAMCDRMTLVLLVAAAVSFTASLVSGGSFADPVIILVIVLVNAFIAAVQESRAEHALEALKKLSSPEITVLRDGRPVRVRGTEIVKGDVFLLEKGDIVPCDALLLSSTELTVDESALTGESDGVLKNAKAIPPEGAALNDVPNAVFTSSSVVSGRGTAVAVRTGTDTCVGEIAGMIAGSEEQTPLQKRLAKLSALLGNLTIGICAAIFGLSMLRGMNAGEMLLTSVSLSVAAIPEGLPAIVTVVLSAGVQTLAGKRAIVKKLTAVETLGCTGVICTDKTGTLTCNKMTVTEFRGDKEKSALCSALCNNGSSPTELALDAFAGNSEKLRTLYPRIKEIPFDSDKKYMVTAHRNGEGFLVLMKGAPDVVKRFCADFPESAVSQTASMASRALRVLCLAGYETKKLPHDLTSQKYTFYGLCGISDPPRPEAAEAVKTCRKAGIRTVMLTGDHPATALAVATELGISPPGGRVCTGSEISAMDEREFRRAVKECSVFARVAPAHKLRVVTALKALGNVVAMTGDGVNDAPALKKADIGCAMGISGTEVAKESADMVLTDDNFATVVSAVREGRGIYENIRRAVHFLLSCNIGELLTVFFSILLNFPSPLSAIQLLWVNLTTDSLPAIALGLEKTPDSVMERPPVKPGTPLFPAARTLRVILEGALIGGLAISAFMIGSGKSFAAGRTMCFLVLSMSQLFHSFNMRSEKSVFSRDVKRNPFVWLSFFVCLAMQLLVLLIPALSSMFGVVPLDPFEWIISFALSAAPLAAGEIYKLFKKR